MILVSGGGYSSAKPLQRGSHAIRVVASVPPAGAVAQAIMEGIADPRVLVTGNASPHHFSFRPSQSSALYAAHLIFAISPGYEQFMLRSVKMLPKTATLIWLDDAPGLTRLPMRNGNGHTGHDPHIWLTPDNIAAMGHYAADTLSSRYPDHAAQFQANADTLEAHMTKLQNSLRDTLQNVKGKKFAAYHDGYQYFESISGITLGAVFSDAVLHQIRPGQLRVIRKQVEEKEITCLVAEPEFDATVIHRLGDELHIPVIILDPEGMTITERGEAFFVKLLTGMADDFHRCFQPS